FGVKGGLAFRFNVLKIDGFLEFTLGVAPEWDIKLNAGWKITKLCDFHPSTIPILTLNCLISSPHHT
ncbi:hypothetical protein, partial [Salmonella enterica]|uniref:hypothetical protein n=1 Tax=Salmonella enterica TaxID=28901 RepID=UPI003EDC91F7